MWALILSYFKILPKFQHRVLFWGIFGALAMRAIFVFAGVALIEKFDWVLYVFGAFLLFTAIKLVVENEEEIDPASGRFYKLINKVVHTSPNFDGQKLFTRENGRRVATPLFAVGLRALYFLLADAHARFSYLKEGLAIILAAAIGFPLKADRVPVPHHENPPPFDER